MTLDIKKIAEELIVRLWAESDKMKERAEGVKLFLHAIIVEGEKLNGDAGSEDSQPGLSEEAETKAE